MSVLAAKFNTLSSYDLDFEGVHSGPKRKQQGLGRVISGHPTKYQYYDAPIRTIWVIGSFSFGMMRVPEAGGGNDWGWTVKE